MSLTPITEIPPAHCNLAETIPEYAQPEKIGLHIPRLGRVAAWGGFYRDQITIVGRPGETSSYNASIVGHDGQGHAMMGAVEAKAVDLVTGIPGTRDTEWRSRASLQLHVNTSELAQRVQETGPSRDPAQWAKHINNALAVGLRDAAWRHLAGKPLPRAETILTASCASGAALANVITLSAELDPHLMSAVMAIGVVSVLSPNFYRTISFSSLLNRSLSEACFSLVPIMHFDRLAIVSGLSRAYRFARVIE